MTLREVLTWSEQVLQEHDVPEAKLNAWYLFVAHLHLNRSSFFLREKEQADEGIQSLLKKDLMRRAEREPLEYILGETEFMGLRMYVNEHVLIPRQDTECLVERVLPMCEDKDVLDLCTGSGCIGISLAKLGRCRSVTLSDVSEKALAIAGKNAQENDVQANIVQGDLFDSVSGRMFDCIVSNPPYIKSEVVNELMPEVRDYEPHLALDGREDGLYFYRRIIEQGREYLRTDGVLAFEIGYDQGVAVSNEMIKAGYGDVHVYQDLAGVDRVVIGRK